MNLVAFESSLALQTSSKEGRGQPTIFCAVLMTLCTDLLSAAEHPAYHTVTQYIKVLSIVERKKGTNSFSDRFFFRRESE